MNTKRLKGSYLACFRDYVAHADLKTAKQGPRKAQLARTVKRQNIVEAFDRDITAHTFYRWTAEKSEPLSEELLTMIFALESIGYEITDRGLKAPYRHKLLGAIALKFTSTQSLSDQLGFGNVQSMASFLTGSANISGEKEKKLLVLLESFDPELGQKMEEFKKRFLEASGLSDEPVETEENEEPAAKPVPPAKNGNAPSAAPANVGDAVGMLAYHIMAALPLAKQLLEQQGAGGVENREKLRLRTRIGTSHGVFDLSNHLNRLCGEKANTKGN